MLEIRHLSLAFAGLKALADVSFDVPARSIVGLIGPNGAGKSTLLNCISRLYTPDAGSIRYEGRDLLRVDAHGLARFGILSVKASLAVVWAMAEPSRLRTGGCADRARRRAGR